MSEQEQNTWDSSEGVFNSNKDADSSIIRVWEGEGGGGGGVGCRAILKSRGCADASESQLN
jgi:hypothetical protein